MFDASDAVDYVRSITGDDVNIIFGAMYDENLTDYCRITVIATGIEESPASRFTATLAKKPMMGGVPGKGMGGISGMKTTVNASGTATTRPYTGPQQTGTLPTGQGTGNTEQRPPLAGLQKPPTNLRSKVEEKSLKIPDFLQRK